MPSKMQAWRSNAVGRDGLRLEAVPVPQPGPGECLVRVEAATLNFSDVLMVDDRYQTKPERPFTMGQELAGTVVARGDGAGPAVGTRIAARIRTGAFAGFAHVPDAAAMTVPDGVAMEAAATLPVVYATAALALTESTRFEPSETLLVLAAAGGVGLAAVEIGAALGGRVIAAAGGAAKGAVALEHGAGHAVDYDRADWPEAVRAIVGGRGVDVVCDNVGGDRTMDALRLLAPGGRLLVIGFASGTIPQIPANRLLLKAASAIGVSIGADAGSARLARARARVGEWAASGAIRPHVGARFAFDALPAALDALAGRQTTGKVVLIVS